MKHISSLRILRVLNLTLSIECKLPYVIGYFFLGCYFALISSCDSIFSYITDEVNSVEF